MYTIKDILRLEVAPALGCTEPIAVALCTAAAASLLKDKNIKSMELWVDPNIYKNGMAVYIPGSDGSYGIDLAGVMGAFGGDPSQKLEVLKNLNPDVLQSAKDFVAAGKIKINVLDKREGIYIHSLVKTENEEAESTIEKLHDNLTKLKYNGKELTNHELISNAAKDKNEVYQLEEWLKELKLEQLISLIKDMDNEDFDFIKQGVRYNVELADYGLMFGPGMGIGLTIERFIREGLLKKDIVSAAKILTSAASDARMSGVNMPAMSSAGSGNHGLTAILPIWAVKDFLHKINEEEVYRAIALSHVITAYIKSYTGRLSAVCGCSVAAGAGATAGITYLMGGTLSHIAGSIINLIEDLAGVICDGAKTSCSLKLATAAGNAVYSALYALHGIQVCPTDGIVAYSPEQTMKNVGKLSTHGMIETDRTILQIMLQKQFEKYN